MDRADWGVKAGERAVVEGNDIQEIIDQER
jgi:hypothetical protein